MILYTIRYSGGIFCIHSYGVINVSLTNRDIQRRTIEKSFLAFSSGITKIKEMKGKMCFQNWYYAVASPPIEVTHKRIIHLTMKAAFSILRTEYSLSH